MAALYGSSSTWSAAHLTLHGRRYNKEEDAAKLVDLINIGSRSLARFGNSHAFALGLSELLSLYRKPQRL